MSISQAVDRRLYVSDLSFETGHGSLQARRRLVATVGDHAVDERDQVFAYPFEGYWVDVGTIEAYWETNLALLDEQPPSKGFT